MGAFRGYEKLIAGNVVVFLRAFEGDAQFWFGVVGFCAVDVAVAYVDGGEDAVYAFFVYFEGFGWVGDSFEHCCAGAETDLV